MLFQDGIGLDISSRQVTAVYLKNSLKGPVVAGQDAWPIDPDQAFRQQMESIARQLRAFIDRHRIGGSGVYIGIPHEKTLLREISLPLAARENLPETLRYELDRYVPIPEEDLFMDFQIIGEDKEAQQLRVLLAAAKKSELSAYLDLAEMTGLGICSIEPTCASSVNLLSTANGILAASDFLLVNGSADGVNLTAVSQGRLRTSRTLHRRDENAPLPQGFEQGLKAIGRNWIQNQTIPDVLCLGTDIDDAIMASVQKVIVGAPCKRLDLGALPVSAWDQLPAYGLALRALKELPVTLNLMPKAMRKKPSRIGQYLLLILITLAVLTGAGWFTSQILHQRLIQNRLETEIARLSEEVAAIESLQDELEAAESRITFLNDLKREGPPTLDILRELSEVIPETAWIREFNISDDKVRLDGYADTAAELVPLLDASSRITDVAFLSAITKGRDGKEKFRIGFTVVRPGDGT